MAKRKENYIQTISRKELQEVVNNSCTYVNVMRFLGFHTCYIGVLKDRLNRDNINHDHIKASKKGKRTIEFPKGRPISDILRKGVVHPDHKKIVGRLVEEGIVKRECGNRECKSVRPAGQDRFLLGHINKDITDNRLSNIRLLCSGCYDRLKVPRNGISKSLKKLYNPCERRERDHKLVSNNRKRVCLYCKKEFLRSHRAHTKVYCSQECSGLAIRFAIPTKDTLVKLLEKNSTSKIARIYGVSQPLVLNWRRFYGLEVKDSLPHRGRSECPPKEVLVRLLSEFHAYEVARKLRVHVATLLKWRKFHGLSMGRKIIKNDVPPRKELVELLLKMTIKKVAEKYGVTSSVLNRWRKIYDIQIRYSDAKIPSKEELATLLSDLFIYEVADKYGVSPNTVNRWKKVYGLTTKIKSRKERWTQIKAEKSIEDSNYMEYCGGVVQGMKDSLGITPEQHKENEQRLRDRVILY